MPRRVAQNVSFTPEHAAFVAAQIASGRYKGVSAVVRAALTALADREDTRAALRSAKADAGRA